MYQIMLVEDEMLVRESMAQNTNWDKFGFAPPHVFENGRQALEQLESVLPGCGHHGYLYALCRRAGVGAEHL